MITHIQCGKYKNLITLSVSFFFFFFVKFMLASQQTQISHLEEGMSLESRTI